MRLEISLETRIGIVRLADQKVQIRPHLRAAADVQPRIASQPHFLRRKLVTALSGGKHRLEISAFLFVRRLRHILHFIDFQIFFAVLFDTDITLVRPLRNDGGGVFLPCAGMPDRRIPHGAHVLWRRDFHHFKRFTRTIPVKQERNAGDGKHADGEKYPVIPKLRDAVGYEIAVVQNDLHGVALICLIRTCVQVDHIAL